MLAVVALRSVSPAGDGTRPGMQFGVEQFEQRRCRARIAGARPLQQQGHGTLVGWLGVAHHRQGIPGWRGGADDALMAELASAGIPEFVAPTQQPAEIDPQ